MRNSKSKCV